MALAEHLGYNFEELPEAAVSDPEAHGLVHKAMAKAWTRRLPAPPEVARVVAHGHSSECE